MNVCCSPMSIEALIVYFGMQCTMSIGQYWRSGSGGRPMCARVRLAFEMHCIQSLDLCWTFTYGDKFIYLGWWWLSLLLLLLILLLLFYLCYVRNENNKFLILSVTMLSVFHSFCYAFWKQWVHFAMYEYYSSVFTHIKFNNFIFWAHISVWQLTFVTRFTEVRYLAWELFS